MKTLILMLFVLLGGCNTLKRSRQSVQHDRQQTFSYLFQEDSSSVIWRFDTDSSFYYHPDRGLWARSGQLWHQLLSQQHSLQVEQIDSAGYASQAEKESESIGSKPGYWGRIILFALVVCIAIYGIRHLRKYGGC